MNKFEGKIRSDGTIDVRRKASLPPAFFGNSLVLTERSASSHLNYRTTQPLYEEKPVVMAFTEQNKPYGIEKEYSGYKIIFVFEYHKFFMYGGGKTSQINGAMVGKFKGDVQAAAQKDETIRRFASCCPELASTAPGVLPGRFEQPGRTP